MSPVQLAPRVQLALNVDDIDVAVAFYSKLFKTEPAKRRPGYANFAIAEPPLKLVLIENPSQANTLNHLGVEYATTEEVAERLGELREAGLPLGDEGEVVCCYARQDKGWVLEAGQLPWEMYTVLSDADQMACSPLARSTAAELLSDADQMAASPVGRSAAPLENVLDATGDAPCCTPSPEPVTVSLGAKSTCC